jgi:hypothetical protein
MDEPVKIVQEFIRQTWKYAVSEAAQDSHGENIPSPRVERAKTWANDLFELVDTHFRLGATFTGNHWKNATELAMRTLDEMKTAPTLETFEQHTLDRVGQNLTIFDLLNAFWWARLQLLPSALELKRLNRIAYSRISGFLENET